MISLSDATVVASGAFHVGAQETAGYEFGLDGHVYKVVNGVATKIGDWITPQTDMGNYECEFTLESGPLSFGTLGSWLDLGGTTAPSFANTLKSIGSTTTKVGVVIRNKTNHSEQASCTVTLIDFLSP